ncbi:MAG: hypothetical protein BWY80_00954 [Firmicutes bacterium ADurb.Bin456]|nr:MAG: hypothetical protein BWY80_00954 [Firmicutes bacterium ADurb.Bin456]
MLFQRAGQRREGRHPSQFRVEPARIYYIVAVGTVPAGFQQGGGVEISYSQAAQVRRQLLSLKEGKLPIKLDPVRGPGGAGNTRTAAIRLVNTPIRQAGLFWTQRTRPASATTGPAVTSTAGYIKTFITGCNSTTFYNGTTLLARTGHAILPS